MQDGIKLNLIKRQNHVLRSVERLLLLLIMHRVPIIRLSWLPFDYNIRHDPAFGLRRHLW